MTSSWLCSCDCWSRMSQSWSSWQDRGAAGPVLGQEEFLCRGGSSSLPTASRQSRCTPMSWKAAHGFPDLQSYWEPSSLVALAT